MSSIPLRARHGRWLAAAVVAVLAASGCGSSSGGSAGGSASGSVGGSAAASSSGASQAPKLQKLRVLLDWFPNPDHIALYTAKDRGYFAKHGLDVTFTPPSNIADPLKLVATGTVPLGISYEPDVLIARAQGLQVTAVASLIPVALNSLLATNKSPVKKPADLAGHSIGTPGLPSDDVYLSQIYAKNHIDPSSVKKVNVSANLIAAMISGKVDATIGGYRNIEAVQLKDRGLDPMVVPVTDEGVPPYDELVVVANGKKLASDQDYQKMVSEFAAGLAEGTATAMSDTQAAKDAMASVAKGYSPSLIGKMVDATAPLLRNPGGFGHMDIAKWQSFADWMVKNHLMPRHVDAKDAVSDAYLPKS